MGIGGEMAWSSTTIHCPTGAVHRPLHFRSSGRRTCRPTSWIEVQSRTNIQSPSHRLPFLLKIKLFISSWRKFLEKKFWKISKRKLIYLKPVKRAIPSSCLRLRRRSGGDRRREDHPGPDPPDPCCRPGTDWCLELRPVQLGRPIFHKMTKFFM